MSDDSIPEAAPLSAEAVERLRLFFEFTLRSQSSHGDRVPGVALPTIAQVKVGLIEEGGE